MYAMLRHITRLVQCMRLSNVCSCLRDMNFEGDGGSVLAAPPSGGDVRGIVYSYLKVWCSLRLVYRAMHRKQITQDGKLPYDCHFPSISFFHFVMGQQDSE